MCFSLCLVPPNLYRDHTMYSYCIQILLGCIKPVRRKCLTPTAFCTHSVGKFYLARPHARPSYSTSTSEPPLIRERRSTIYPNRGFHQSHSHPVPLPPRHRSCPPRLSATPSVTQRGPAHPITPPRRRVDAFSPGSRAACDVVACVLRPPFSTAKQRQRQVTSAACVQAQERKTGYTCNRSRARGPPPAFALRPAILAVLSRVSRPLSSLWKRERARSRSRRPNPMAWELLVRWCLLQEVNACLDVGCLVVAARQVLSTQEFCFSKHKTKNKKMSAPPHNERRFLFSSSRLKSTTTHVNQSRKWSLSSRHCHRSRLLLQNASANQKKHPLLSESRSVVLEISIDRVRTGVVTAMRSRERPVLYQHL